MRLGRVFGYLCAIICLFASFVYTTREFVNFDAVSFSGSTLSFVYGALGLLLVIVMNSESIARLLNK